jgi:hypothetical protein
MRGVVLIAGLVFGFAASASGTDLLPEARYEQDGLTLCRERHSVEVLDECLEVAVRAASILAAMERGVPVEPGYSLDGDTDRKKAQRIAVECREQTMDGKRVDPITAMACVSDEIGIQNWATRRAKRLIGERNGDR